MARETVWRRSWATYANSETPQDTHLVKLCDLSPGETITRVRFNYWIGIYPTNQPDLPQGVMFGAAVIMVQDGVPVPLPLDQPDADWMWWETTTVQTDFFYQPLTGTALNVLTAPLDPVERDVRAQRLAPAGLPSAVYLQTHSEDAFFADHLMSYGASCLVLLP